MYETSYVLLYAYKCAQKEGENEVPPNVTMLS